MITFDGGIRRQEIQDDWRSERRRFARAAWALTIWSCALAVAAVTLALPATAMGATVAGGRQTTAAPGAQANVADQTLAPGAGYGAPNGSLAVRMLQSHLARTGFPPGPIDGRYGPLTRRAVADFQASHGLQVDGVVGPDTRAALTSSRLTLFPGAGNQPGGSGLVRTLQRRLALAGYAPGPIDGRYGQLTERAVRRFQATHGLPVNGVAGPSVLSLTTTPAHSVSNQPQRSPAVRTSQPAVGASQHRQEPRAATAPVTTNIQRPTHSSSSPSAALVAILSVALLALVALATWWYLRRGRDHRVSPAPGPRIDASGTSAVERHSNLVLPPDDDTAVATASGSEGPDGGLTVTAAPNGSDRLERGHTAPAKPNGVRPVEGIGTATATLNGSERLDGEALAAIGDGAPNHRKSAAAGANVGGVDQHDGETAFNRGLTLEDHGDVAGAIEAYRRADEQGHAPAASNLGVLLEEHGASDAAEAAYRRADQRGDATGAFNLGVLLEERGALTEAEAAYGRADRRGHAAAASNLGVLLERRGAPTDAESAYRRADQRGDATGAFNLGVLLEERGDLADADDAYTRADERGNGDVAKVARAALLELRGRMQESGSGRAAAGHNHG